MSTITFDKDLFKDAKRHSVGMVVLAATLLALASVSLLVSSLFASSTVIMIGQVMFVVFVFTAVTVLVITAIAQDIRRRRVFDDGRAFDDRRKHGI